MGKLMTTSVSSKKKPVSLASILISSMKGSAREKGVTL